MLELRMTASQYEATVVVADHELRLKIDMKLYACSDFVLLKMVLFVNIFKIVLINICIIHLHNFVLMRISVMLINKVC